MTDHDQEITQEGLGAGSGAGSGAGAAGDRDVLVARLRAIEDQPLVERAAAYGQLHDELQAALEDGDRAPGGR